MIALWSLIWGYLYLSYHHKEERLVDFYEAESWQGFYKFLNSKNSFDIKNLYICVHEAALYKSDFTPVEKVRFALAEDFLGRVDEMIERVQAGSWGYRLMTQQSLFMARGAFLHYRHDVRALQQGRTMLLWEICLVVWSEYGSLTF